MAEARCGGGRAGRADGSRPPGAARAARGRDLGANGQLLAKSWSVEVGQSGQEVGQKKTTCGTVCTHRVREHISGTLLGR